MDLSTRVPSMGWTPRSAAGSVLLALSIQRQRAGERVVALREGKDWTHEHLAHEAHVSVKTISRIENGKHDTRKSTRDLVAAALETTSDLIWDRPAPLGLGVEDPVQDQLNRIEKMLEELLVTPSAQTRAKGAARKGVQRSRRKQSGSPSGRTAPKKADQA